MGYTGSEKSIFIYYIYIGLYIYRFIVILSFKREQYTLAHVKITTMSDEVSIGQ